jgi:hypothetical protein
LVVVLSSPRRRLNLFRVTLSPGRCDPEAAICAENTQAHPGEPLQTAIIGLTSGTSPLAAQM